MKKSLAEKRMSEEADKRSHLYSFLSLIFEKEMSPEFLQEIREPGMLNTFSEMGITLEKTSADANKKEELEELKSEYTRLFLGPGKHISPHESVHRSDESGGGLLWGKSTVEFKQFVEWLGLKFSKDYRGIPDHVSVELECMQKLIERETEAWKAGDDQMALQCLNKERWFIKEHLFMWIPGFCNRVIETASLPFYREMSMLMKEWLDIDSKHIDLVLEQTVSESGD